METKIYPLSLSQRDIYFDQLHRMNNPMYNIGGYMTLAELDIAKLEAAHKTLVESYAAFGVRVKSGDTDVYQYITEQRTTCLPLIDFSQHENPSAAADEWLTALFETPINIHESELFKAYLLKLSEQEYRYIGLAHHLIMDGWGFANWTYDLCCFYNGDIPKGNDKWLETIEKEQQYLTSAKYEKDQAFWHQHCAQLGEKLFTPFYQTQFEKKKTPSGRSITRLNKADFDGLVALSKTHQLGLAQLLLACTASYFANTYQVEHFTFGIPSHNRKGFQEKSSIGVSVGVNPLNIQLSRDMPLLQLAKQLGLQQKQAFRHQRFPMGHVISQLDGLTDKSELYEVGFNYLKLDSQLNFNGHRAKLVYLSNNHETTPLLLTIWDYGDEGMVELQLDYSHAYFTEQEAELVGKRLQFTIEQMVKNPDASVNQLKVVPPCERQLITQFTHGQHISLNPNTTLIDLFEQTVKQHRHSTAAVFNEQQLTYQHLQQQADQVAAFLQAQGIKSGASVGVCLQRGLSMLSTILGIMKTGATYIPLDPNYPSSRLQHIINDSHIQHVMTETDTRALLKTFNDVSLHLVADILANTNDADMPGPFVAPQIAANDVAYVIYTSGSTGLPKGVEITHQNAVAMVEWAMQQYTQQQLSNVLVSTSLNFDLSIFEIFVPLSVGGCCVVVKDALALLDADFTTTLQQCHNIELSLINTVPSAMKALLEMNAIPSSVSVVNLAGEALAKTVVNDILITTKVKQVYNLYGPSEDTTYSTFAVFDKPLTVSPSIGCPIANTQAYIVASDEQIQPLGIPGELYLSGAGVAKQYRNNALLTAEKFAPCQAAGNHIAYRTGDLVRLTTLGQLEFLGRLDHQVKVRGFRVELGEIEHQLNRLPSIKESIVVVHGEYEDAQLIAYVVADDNAQENQQVADIEGEQILSTLANVLPDYMVPTIITVLPSMPLTPNGKIDRKALTAMPIKPMAVGTSNQSLHTSTEKQLAGIWSDVLGVQELGRYSDFFTCGGHSLLAIRLLTRIGEQFLIAMTLPDLFQHASLYEMAAFIDASQCQPQHGINNTAIEAAPQYADIPLSQQQAGLWLLEQAQGPSAKYNMTIALTLTGQLDVHAMEQAIRQVALNHKVLRTQLIDSELGVTQRFSEQANFPFELSQLASAQNIQAHVTQEMATPLALNSSSLMRAKLLRIEPTCGNAEATQHVLLITLHHIICDGWSLNIIAQDLSASYALSLDADPSILAASTVVSMETEALTYADYAYAQASSLPINQKDLEFWQAKLQGAPKLHTLPVIGPRVAQQASMGHSITETLSEQQYQKLRTLAATLKVTPSTILQAAYTILLSRWSNSDDIVIGVPHTGRDLQQTHSMVGCFTNVLANRCELDVQQSVTDLIHQVHQDYISTTQYAHVPLSKLVEQLVTERSQSYHPLVQLLFNYQEVSERTIAFEGLDTALIDVEETNIRFDLELHVEHDGHAMALKWLYADGLFEPALMQRMVGSFAVLLDAMLNTPTTSVGALPLVTAAAKLESVEAGASTSAMHLTELVTQQAQKNPDAIAVSAVNEQLSYADLELRTNQLAGHLIESGVQLGDAVGVSLDRDSHLIIAVLAILKAGAHYIPLDPSYPKERLAYIIDDCAAVNNGKMHVICNQHHQALFTATDDVQLHDVNSVTSHLAESIAQTNTDLAQRLSAINAEHLAYVIYTSGSTGKPKGVEIRHRNALALVEWALAYFKPSDLRAVLASTSLNFDLSVFEIFVTLAAGGQCVVVKDALSLLDSTYTNNTIDISLINTVPSAMKVLLEQGAVPASTQVINLAGEPLSASVVNHILATTSVHAVYNLYGPSEDTTYSTVAKFTSPMNQAPTIGQPISQTQAYVVAQGGQLQPAGAPGELYLGGEGVAKGYRGLAKMTAEKFVDNYFDATPNGSKLYKTGDLVRYNEAHQLEFLGRTDYQVKLRGFRIELGEIEVGLQQLALVKEAVVTVLESKQDDQQLVAYITLEEISDEQASQIYAEPLQLNQTLSEFVPDYMLPQHIMVLDTLPLTPNGKIDRKSLPVPSINQHASAESTEHSATRIQLPTSELEQQIATIWQQLLGRDSISITDNFFAIGGHSLLAARMVHLAAQQYNIQVKPQWVYKAQSIAELAKVIEQHQDNHIRVNSEHKADSEKVSSLTPLAAQRLTSAPLSSSQYRIWFIEQLKGATTEHNIVGGIWLQGNVTQQQVGSCLAQLAERHPILKMQLQLRDHQPSQKINPDFCPQLNYHDCTAEYHIENARQQLVTAHSEHVFNINAAATDAQTPQNAELWSALMIQVAPERAFLHFNFHHLLIDGWSLSLFVQDLLQLLNQQQLSAEGERVDYFDYAHWQQQQLASQTMADSLAFWQSYLKGCNDGISLPFDAPTEAELDETEYTITLDNELTVALGELANKHNGSLVNVLHSGLALLLARLTGELDINIGIPVSGRMQSAIAQTVGNFINNLPLRSQLTLQQSFVSLLQQEIENSHQVLAHQDVPFESILEQHEGVRGQGTASTPLFQVFFNMLNLPTINTQDENAAVTADIEISNTAASKFDLTLYVQPVEENDEQSTVIRFNYNTSKFARSSIVMFAQQYVALLQQIIMQPDMPCGAYSLTPSMINQYSDDERLSNVSLPDMAQPLDMPWPGSVTDLIAQQAQTQPNAVAIEHLNRQWTYKEVDNITSGIAQQLQIQGVTAGDTVAIATTRTDLQVCATLAVLKLGAAFVMMSANWPAERSHHIVSMSQAKVIITLDQNGADYAKQLSRGIIVALDAEQLQAYSITAYPDVAYNVQPDDTAYIAFTSGTEGKPKGVKGSHRSLTQFNAWMSQAFNLTHTDRFGMLSGLVHDPLHRDMFTPLMLGATLVVPTQSEFEYDRLGRWLIEQRISVLHLTPSLGALIAQTSATQTISSLHCCFFVGEKLTKAHVSQFKQFAPNMQIVNLYGSTETSRAVGYYVIKSDSHVDDLPDVSPAGVGVKGAQLLVLNDQQQLCGVAELGQIAIRSHGLALGYLHDDALTAQRFMCIAGQQERFYLTGDLGRYDSAGNVICLGRRDRQVKIRGFRVELAELEVACAALPTVSQCVVLADESSGDVKLRLYVVLAADNVAGDEVDEANALINQQQIQSALAQQLPDYMRPDSMTVVAAIPQTENGKVDNHALLALTTTTLEAEADIPPSTPLESQLCQLWSSILGAESVGINRNFFDIGGNSLLMTQLLARLQSDFNVTISYQDFFENASVQAVAAAITHQQAIQQVFAKNKNKKKVLL
ncbi:non-ribosomal peptide synthetase [Flocculibacter collagenilyticus]|uniref:non-ribosomal peptide synthetase n=1 Tax=Flocculibacter collagenilyticus TaxID=2744479 RepID=UPI0018F4071B|nr:non-ribosomal peptide synthetase [Flocculibacter collagenilyticus]